MNWQQNKKELKRRTIKGVVIDTGKFDGWQKLMGKKAKVYRKIVKFLEKL